MAVSVPLVQLNPAPSAQIKTPTRMPLSFFKTTTAPPNAETPQAHALVEKAKNDLAARLGVPGDLIQVVEVNFTELTPDDLKCSHGDSGMEVPMIVFGYELILQVQGVTYRYVGRGQEVIYCPREF